MIGRRWIDFLLKFDNWKWKTILLISLSVIIKWTYFLIINNLTSNNSPHLFNVLSGDDKTYMEFCENFYSKGKYFVKTGLAFDYTFRMPGFNFLYYPLRLFFNKELTMDGIIIIQTTLSGIACFYLAKIAQYLFKSRRYFYIAYIIGFFGLVNAFFNNQLMRESLAFSSIIFTIYFMLKGIESKRAKFFLLSGFFMTWLIFLRPYTIVLYACLFCVLIYLIYKKKLNFKNFIYYNLIFTILVSFWTYRNFTLTKSFIPLESSISWAGSSKLVSERLDFIRTFGFQCEFWIPNTQSAWFDNEKSNKEKKYVESIFPSRTFNGDLTIDSLFKLKENYDICIFNKLEKTKKNENEVIRLFIKFREELKKQRPFDYYFMNRLRIVKSFLRENTFVSVVEFKYPYNVIGVFTETYYNITLKLIGFFGLLIITLKFFRNYLILGSIVFFPIFILFFFPIYSGLDESRFFFLAVPFFIIAATYFIVNMMKKNIFKLLILSISLIFPILFSIEKVKELIHF